MGYPTDQDFEDARRHRQPPSSSKSKAIIDEVATELARANVKFPSFNSAHEGFAVLKEEVDELWEEVRGKTDCDQTERKHRMRKEAIQVAAMAIRLIKDVCDA
jgi:hypothetical protein